jgi:DNA recombination protein RmuC
VTVLDAIIAVVAVLIGLAAGYLIASRLGCRNEQLRREDLAGRLSEAQATLAHKDAALQETGQQVALLQAQLEEREKSLQTAADLEKKMQQAFGELSQSALSRTSEDFLRLASQRFESLSKETQGQLATREEAIKGLVDPLTQLLTKYDQALQDMELKRQTAYTSLDERLKTLAEAESNLQKETGRLVSALRRPEVRGHWGEMQLRNAVELAGMSEYCDFVEQEHMEGATGAQRPDMVIRLPGNRTIIVDAKVPLNAYLDALECEDQATRQRLFEDHARQCRTHLDSLAAKKYWESVENAPDCVVMFIPGESLFAAAVEADRDLISRGWHSKVIVATPSTFIALLYAVSYGWQQQTFAENAQKVRDLAAQLYDRLRTFAGHFQSVGSNLDRSVEAYNKSVGSLERQLLVSARKLKDMGVTGKEDLPEIKPVETITRDMGSELNPTLPAVELSETHQTEAESA